VAYGDHHCRGQLFAIRIHYFPWSKQINRTHEKGSTRRCTIKRSLRPEDVVLLREIRDS
jgi:hypothetical protein